MGAPRMAFDRLPEHSQNVSRSSSLGDSCSKSTELWLCDRGVEFVVEDEPGELAGCPASEPGSSSGSSMSLAIMSNRIAHLHRWSMARVGANVRSGGPRQLFL